MEYAVKGGIPWAPGELFDIFREIGTEESLEKMVSLGNKYMNKKMPNMIGRMGLIYASGEGVKKDLKMAASLMREAYDSKVRWASWNLVDILWGINTEDSLKEALIICKEPNNSKEPEIIGRLGKAYRFGIGTPIDILKAEKYLAEAEIGGEVKWVPPLLYDTLWAINTEESLSKMKQLGEKYASANNPDMLRCLARAYTNGKGVKIDLNKAASLIRIAYKNGSKWASWELFKILWLIDTPEAIKEMIQLIPPLIAADDALAYGQLSKLYFFGKGIEKDYTISLYYLNKGLAKFCLTNDALKQYPALNEKSEKALLKIDSLELYFKQINSAKGILRLLQLSSLKLLKQFDDICRNNDIKYWAMFGTALGSRRHCGFIPWDDDIDVGMLKEDILKLQANVEKYKEINLVEGYIINNTSAHYYSFRQRNYEDIFKIDIFIFERTDKTIKNAHEKFCVTKDKLNKHLVSQAANLNLPLGYNIETPEYFGVIQEQYRGYLKDYNEDGKNIVWSVENFSSSYNAFFTENEIFPLKNVMFENICILGPNNIDSVLKKIYTSYMELPRDLFEHQHIILKNKQISRLRAYLKNELELSKTV